MTFDEGGVVARVDDYSDRFRSVELLASWNYRAERSALRPLKEADADSPAKLEVGDLVLVASGKYLNSTLKWPAFSSKYFDPCLVVSAHRPSYTLVSPHNWYNRHGIHARRLKKYIARPIED